jgi:hypothetical protein
MIADQVGNNRLFAQIEPDQRVGIQQVIAVPIVVDRIDKMPNIVK